MRIHPQPPAEGARISSHPSSPHTPTSGAWFDRAFGSWYLQLYPHRDRAEAEQGVRLIASHLPPQGRILDIGTGTGRYQQALRNQGFRTVGIDRSDILLREAAATGELSDGLARADMRYLPVQDHGFDGVVSMFTSFGYFETAADHVHLLREFHRVCAPLTATLVLDYLNDLQVRESLVARSERQLDGIRVEEERWIDSGPPVNRVVKRLTFWDDQGKRLDQYEERVALFSSAEVETMLEAAGWRLKVRYGDYSGGPWSPGSPRNLMIARGEGGRP